MAVVGVKYSSLQADSRYVHWFCPKVLRYSALF